ncbi:MAG: M23 family metallopeptidase [Gemmatimonadetes bacterium]|nr:M23 family metallopeptidase [Gemmatimonadota bacterium]
MRSGRVTHAGPLGAYGLTVEIDHGGDVTSLYGHLSRIDVAAGTSVERGRVLGLSGRTGNATAPHLHFEIRRWGRPEDPIPLLGGPPRADPGPSGQVQIDDAQSD